MTVDAPDRAALTALLAETPTLTLATLDPDHTPRATPLFFAVSAAGDLVFLSDPATRHAANLARQPRAAIGAYPDIDNWRQLRGVQMKGVVTALDQPAAGEALEAYRTRFPFLDEVPAGLAAMHVYRFRPDWVRLIDNRRGFGWSMEWSEP